jgi:hypothetical protein
MTPYEAWYGRKPSVDHLCTFRCVAHVKTVAEHLSKLADQSTPMVMIGYEAGTKAYCAYNPVNKKLVVTRDVLFEEEKSWNRSSAEPVEPILNEIFTVVYSDDLHADNQHTLFHDDADHDDTNSSPEASSSLRMEDVECHAALCRDLRGQTRARLANQAEAGHGDRAAARAFQAAAPKRARQTPRAGVSPGGQTGQEQGAQPAGQLGLEAHGAWTEAQLGLALRCRQGQPVQDSTAVSRTIRQRVAHHQPQKLQLTLK